LFFILGYQCAFPKETKEVELPNARTFVELGMDEMPSTLRVESLVPCSHVIEVIPFHVIFNLNKILVATCFDEGEYGKVASHTIIFQLGLKENLKKCVK